MALANAVLMLPNAVLMTVARDCILAVAPRAMIATTKAYSTRS
jgi:hypothetical protein